MIQLTEAQKKEVKAIGFLWNKGTDRFNGRIITVNGKITPKQAKCAAEAAEKVGATGFALTSRLTIEVVGIPYDKIQEFRDLIAEEGLITGGTGSKVRPVVSCKGTTCQYGLHDCYGISEEIHNEFFEGYKDVKLPHKFKIGVGGCPNSCIKPGLNDVGIVGQLIPVYESEDCRACKKCGVEIVCPVKAAKRNEDNTIYIDEEECTNCGLCVDKCHFDLIEEGIFGYEFLVGGRWGKKVQHAVPLTELLKTKEDVLSAIEKTILFFREQGKTGERLSDTINRLGFEHANKEILGDEILSRKEKILSDTLHESGGATC